MVTATLVETIKVNNELGEGVIWDDQWRRGLVDGY